MGLTGLVLGLLYDVTVCSRMCDAYESLGSVLWHVPAQISVNKRAVSASLIVCYDSGKYRLISRHFSLTVAYNCKPILIQVFSLITLRSLS
jgi:hypothetical protein